MIVRLDPRSDNPIYLQIADSIAELIESGSLPSGERLPSARSLAESLGVNMHTVLKAYAELERRSMVEMRRGRAGVVVREQADLSGMARALVQSAKRTGMSKGDLIDIVSGAWK